MNEREAINDLNYLCKGITNLNTLESITLGIKALEKQIPKKPQIYNNFERHCECGAIVKSYFNYCYECGQALE